MAIAQQSIPARLREGASVTVAPRNAVLVPQGQSSADWLAAAGGRLTDGPVQTETGAPTGYQRRERPPVEQGQS